MKKYFLVFILISCFVQSKAQKIMMIGEEVYESTEDWKFNPPSITLNVIKSKSKSGHLVITSTSFQLIKGTFYIYLDDLSIIKCYDKNKKDAVDGENIIIYDFTKSEIQRLKEHRIIKIRYSVYSEYSSEKEDYTADNDGYQYFQYRINPNQDYDPKKYIEKTEEDIKNLFDE